MGFVENVERSNLVVVSHWEVAEQCRFGAATAERVRDVRGEGDSGQHAPELSF